MTDTERLDWLAEHTNPHIWIDSSSGYYRYSCNGGESWHDTLREAIDNSI